MEILFLPGNTPSKKNSKQWVGKMLINSKTVRNYLKNYEIYWRSNLNNWKSIIQNIEPPYRVGFYFVRDTKRKFDYNNISQICTDLMKKHGWLEDDNLDCIIPYFLGSHVDKENSGAYIFLLSENLVKMIDEYETEIKTKVLGLINENQK